MTHDEEEDESAWLGGGPLGARDEDVKRDIGELLDKISSATGIPKKELEERSTRAITTKKEEDPDHDPDFDFEEEEELAGELDLPETKEEAARELTALEKELEEKRRRLEMTPSERREEDERKKKEWEEEFKKRSGAKIPAPRPPGLPSSPGTGTPPPKPTVKAAEMGECCSRMKKELLEKTNVQWWNDHKGNKLIAFSHTYLKLLHCPWCGAKIE